MYRYIGAKKMEKLTAKKYRELFGLRAEGKLDDMECTKSLYNILESLYSDGITILDVPCGVGHYFRKIRELGNLDYLGIDLDSEAIAVAKEIWKDVSHAKFDVQDAANLNFEDNSFDVVYCYNLLLHLKDYKKVLEELFRVSKRYIIVRSLFDEEESINSVDVAEDYLDVYPTGRVQYNTYARDDVAKFLKGIGSCEFRFIKDNLPIPQKSIERQEKILKVDSSEFAKGEGNKKQDWKGLELNYAVLFIEKLRE